MSVVLVLGIAAMIALAPPIIAGRLEGVRDAVEEETKEKYEQELNESGMREDIERATEELEARENSTKLKRDHGCSPAA